MIMIMSMCQISCRSVKPLPRCGHFSTFQDGGHPPCWIKKCEMLTADTVRRVKIRYRVKLRWAMRYDGPTIPALVVVSL